MSDHHVPALRRRFLEDMRIKGLQPKTQTMYLRAMRDFTRFLSRSPDTATPEDLRAFQLDMKEKGVGAPTFNNRLSVLGFFFSVTCARAEMKRHMRYQRLAKKIPVVLSAEEVTRILEVAPGPGLKYKRGDRMKVMRLPTEEFIRRFLVHVLPSRFHRIRHAGFLANGIRRDRIEKIRCLIDREREPDKTTGEDGRADADTRDPRQTCPECGGAMIVSETFTRGQTPKSRAPPWEDAA